MKKIINWVLFATLFLGLTIQTSCSSDHDGDSVNEEVQKERDELLTHIEDDAQVMDENLDFELLDLTTQVQAQLLDLMGKAPRFSGNLKKVVSALAVQKAFQNIRQVESGSELASMGYLAYIPVDIMAFGVRVIFDEKGNYNMTPTEGLEFIFPATVEGYGQTLYKIALKNDGNWYEAVMPAKFNGVRGLACVNRFPEKLNLRMTGLFNDEEVTLLTGMVNIVLEKEQGSQYVSFQANNFQISAQLNSALKGNQYGLPNDDSAISFTFGTSSPSKDGQEQMNLLCSFSQKGLNLLNAEALVALAEQKSFIDRLSEDIFTSSDWKSTNAFTHLTTAFSGCSADVTMKFLDDLTLSGTIEDSEQFFQALGNVAQNKEESQVSAEEFNSFVQNLNESCHFTLTCPQITQQVPLQLMAQQEDTRNILLPALQFADSPNFFPLHELVTEETNERLRRMYEKTSSFVSNTLNVDMQLIYRMMQSMPMNSEEWGL